MPSSAAAAKYAKENKNILCIVNSLAVENYKLRLVKKNIQDLVGAARPSISAKSSFSFKKARLVNSPGNACRKLAILESTSKAFCITAILP